MQDLQPAKVRGSSFWVVFIVHAAPARAQYRGSTARAARAKKNGMNRSRLALSVPGGRPNLYLGGCKAFPELKVRLKARRSAPPRRPCDAGGDVVDPGVLRARPAVTRAHLWPCRSAGGKASRCAARDTRMGAETCQRSHAQKQRSGYFDHRLASLLAAFPPSPGHLFLMPAPLVVRDACGRAARVSTLPW